MRDPLGNIRALKGWAGQDAKGRAAKRPQTTGQVRLLYAHVDPQKSRMFCLHRVLDGGS